jgi:hypothetical protein
VLLVEDDVSLGRRQLTAVSDLHLQIHWMLAMNAQGLTRLDKWFTPHTQVPQLNSKPTFMSHSLIALSLSLYGSLVRAGNSPSEIASRRR